MDMYIIEFEEGVYATKGVGDPARTLKIENAVRYSDKTFAKKELTKTIKRVAKFRTFTNPQVRWVDEVSPT
jgi:hypothetical protein